jgi:hypothetical protein
MTDPKGRLIEHRFKKQSQFVLLATMNAEFDQILQNKPNPSGTNCRTGLLEVVGIHSRLFVVNFKKQSQFAGCQSEHKHLCNKGL